MSTSEAVLVDTNAAPHGSDAGRGTARWVRPMPGRAARRLGLLATLVTAAAYTPGLGRAIDFDGAETVGFFVRTPSLPASLFTQREFNNPPLFSFVEHLIGIVTGSYSPATMRMLPIACSAVAVGLVMTAVARRWGWLPAVAAAAVLATNPMFEDESRAVRGYSMLVLCAVGATLLLLALRSSEAPDRRRSLAYSLVAGAGLATHLFMLPVLGVHLAIALDDRRRRGRRAASGDDAAAPEQADRAGAGDRPDEVWPVVRGIAIGAVPWMVILPTMLSYGQEEGRQVQLPFALNTTYQVVGGTHLATAILGLVALAGLAVLWHHRVVRVALVVAIVAAAGAWLGLAPGGIVPRWYMWLVPGPAVLAARAVRSRPWVVALVAVSIASSTMVWLPHMSHGTNSIAESAHIVQEADRHGWHACVENVSASAVLSVTGAFDPAVTEADFARCDLVVSPFPELDAKLTAAADRDFPHVVALPATLAGRLWSRRPVPVAWLQR